MRPMCGVSAYQKRFGGTLGNFAQLRVGTWHILSLQPRWEVNLPHCTLQEAQTFLSPSNIRRDCLRYRLRCRAVSKGVLAKSNATRGSSQLPTSQKTQDVGLSVTLVPIESLLSSTWHLGHVHLIDFLVHSGCYCVPIRLAIDTLKRGQTILTD